METALCEGEDGTVRVWNAVGTYGYIVAMQAAAQMLKALPASMPAAMRDGPA